MTVKCDLGSDMRATVCCSPWPHAAAASSAWNAGGSQHAWQVSHLAALRHATSLKPPDAEQLGEHPGQTWLPISPALLANRLGDKGKPTTLRGSRASAMDQAARRRYAVLSVGARQLSRTPGARVNKSSRQAMRAPLRVALLHINLWRAD